LWSDSSSGHDGPVEVVMVAFHGFMLRGEKWSLASAASFYQRGKIPLEVRLGYGVLVNGFSSSHPFGQWI